MTGCMRRYVVCVLCAVHAERVTQLAWSPCQTHLATLSDKDGVAFVWAAGGGGPATTAGSSAC